MIAELVPGKDVTWLQAPSPPADTKVAGIEGCTGDPCETGFVPSSIRIVANKEFLEENPAAGRLLELVRINPRDIFEQNLKMRRGENTQADIEKHAKQWIEANKAEVDRWLGEARSATGSNERGCNGEHKTGTPTSLDDRDQGGLGPRVDLAVFIPAAAITVIFLIWGMASTESLAAVTGAIMGFLVGDIGWVYVMAVCGFSASASSWCSAGMVTSGWARTTTARIQNISWISMMFAAGMGIGLLFYGVAEPISHFAAPPPGLAEPKTEEAARIAMQYTFLHWGVTGWAIYAIAGLALAYFGYRHGGRNLMSTACRPILGDRVDGWLGKSLDTAAVVATLFGLIPSLGMGALQVNGAMEYLWGVPTSTTVQMIFIAVVTVMFVLSATTGVGRACSSWPTSAC